jgi:hypothetical protein
MYESVQTLWYKYVDLVAEPKERHAGIADTLTQLSAAVSIILTKSKSDLDELSAPI